MTPPTCDWVDDVAVERVMKRQPIGRRLTDAERAEVIRRIKARGGGASQISRVLRVNGTTARQLAEDT